MIVIRIKKLPYNKPDKDNLCLVYSHLHGNRLDFVVKKKNITSKINNYRRIKGNKIINSLTGEVKKCKIHAFQTPQEVFKKLKYSYYLITENWFGTDCEMLIHLKYDKTTIPQQMSKDFESFSRKFQRRIGQKIRYVNILLYNSEKVPYYAFWISSTENKEILMSKRELQSIWTHGEITITKLTENNLDQLADYYIAKKHNCRLDVYPANVKVFRTSRTGIEKVEPEQMTYEKAEKLVQDEYKMIFGTTKTLTDTVNGKEIELQRYNFESYIKEES